jgi:hypothetical protein
MKYFETKLNAKPRGLLRNIEISLMFLVEVVEGEDIKVYTGR